MSIFQLIFSDDLINLLQNLVLNLLITSQIMEQPGQEISRGVKSPDHKSDGLGDHELVIVSIVVQERVQEGSLFVISGFPGLFVLVDDALAGILELLEVLLEVSVARFVRFVEVADQKGVQFHHNLN